MTSFTNKLIITYKEEILIFYKIIFLRYFFHLIFLHQNITIFSAYVCIAHDNWLVYLCAGTLVPAYHILIIQSISLVSSSFKSSAWPFY